MSSKIIRATAAADTVRMFVADTTEIVAKATVIHGLSHLAAAALGRTLTVAAIMGQMGKGTGVSTTLQFKGDGPLGTVCAVTDDNSNVRGYVSHPHVELPLREDGKINVGAGIGKGYLNVIKDFGVGDPYIGQIELISGEVGVDLTYYFASSEQTPSVVAVGVLVAPTGEILHAGGYVIQLMPGVEDKVITYIENTVDALPPVTTLLSWGETPESIADLFFGAHELKIHETVESEYKCNCSREKMERGLISLGKKELKNLSCEQDVTKCHCHFCNKDYEFTSEDLMKLYNEI